MAGCAGRDLGRKKFEDIISYQKCPSCSYDIEYFFDDVSRRCPGCGIIVNKEDARLLSDYGCAKWCRDAERCLGHETYIRFREARERIEKSRLERIAESL